MVKISYSQAYGDNGSYEWCRVHVQTSDGYRNVNLCYNVGEAEDVARLLFETLMREGVAAEIVEAGLDKVNNQ